MMPTSRITRGAANGGSGKRQTRKEIHVDPSAPILTRRMMCLS